jgi:hypothetical protein
MICRQVLFQCVSICSFVKGYDLSFDNHGWPISEKKELSSISTLLVKVKNTINDLICTCQ